MLPYSPLHQLLLADFSGPLVMTSGNLSDDPIAFEDADALERLAPIADVFLVHDRAIHARTDDSVVRARGAMLRRSRGYVPAALALPIAPARPLLACGAEQKNTFCVAKGRRAWVSHHIGDLEHYSAFESFKDGIEHFQRLFAVAPVLVVHDLHPEYLSTKYALERAERDGDVQLIGVQHHHAHLAAVLAEHGLTGRAVAATFDGTGYGTDGTIWGGELLVGDLCDFERVGSLHPVRMPGGAAAIREPWRMAFAWLAEAFGGPQPLPARLAAAGVAPAAWRAMAGVLASDAVSPVTTSIGRLFDAVGALCGIAARASYEGQAAVELEWAATAARRHRRYEVCLDGDRDRSGPRDPRNRRRPGRGASPLSTSPPASTARSARRPPGPRPDRGRARARCGRPQRRRVPQPAALGCRPRRSRTARSAVLTPRLLPPGDGAIAFGQAAVAAARVAAAESM